MPATGVSLTPPSSLLSSEQILRVVRVLASAGAARKVRLTGGEPLIRKDAVNLISSIAKMPGVETVCMTTNGTALASPSMCSRLRSAGLSSVNISLDTLFPAKFESISRRPGILLGRVLRGIDAAVEEFGPRAVRVNMVVMGGDNDDEILPIGERFARDRGVQVRYIELMPFATPTTPWAPSRVVPIASILARFPGPPAPLPVTDPAATARLFAVPGWRGEVGVIASMTAPFCAGCNRTRLTADGTFKVCLFDDESRGTPLLPALAAGASDAELLALCSAAVGRKFFALGGHGGAEGVAAASGGNRPMTTIGG